MYSSNNEKLMDLKYNLQANVLATNVLDECLAIQQFSMAIIHFFLTDDHKYVI